MAGVSRGAQEHYFRTKNDLVVATLKYAMDKAIEHARSLAENGDHSADSIDRFLADSEHFFLSPRYRALVEIMVAARAQPKLLRHWSPLVRDARRTLNKIWTDRLTGAGYKPAEVNRFIELTHYLLRGLMLAETWLPYEANRREVLRVWRSLAPAILRDRAS
jgi:AcrR family transcriptional regulator